MRQLPNLICLLRIALVWPILLSIEQGAFGRALLLFFVAAASDGLDGFLAKHFHWTSELGKFLDPIADKLLLVSVFLLCTWYGLIPHWVTIAAVARDVMIGLGAIIFRLWWGPLNGRPMVSSKVNTLVQLCFVLAVVAHAGFLWPPAGLVQALAVLTLVTVLFSGFVYAQAFTRRALQSSAPAA